MFKIVARKSEEGQVLLIVILVMVVALTIGLSVATRSITSLRTATEQAESQKALAAAEAGIEQAINTESFSPSGSLGNANYTVETSTPNGAEFLLNGGNAIPKNDGFDVWLSDYSPDPSLIYLNQKDTNLTIYWGDSADGCNNAALEVAVLYDTKAAPKITRYALDPCQARRDVNKFTFVSGGGGVVQGKSFPFGTTIAITQGFIARIIPLYKNANVGVTSTTLLPDQGKTITSSGTFGSTERKVTVFQSYPSVPAEFFPYNLFSPL